MQSDANTSTCAQCGTQFSLFKFKHHCVGCNKLYCADCVDTISEKIENPGVSTPDVCKACYPSYDKQQGAPAKGAVSAGKTRICVAGYGISPNYTRANNVALLLLQDHKDKYEYWTYGPDRSDFFVWLVGWKEKTISSDSPYQSWKTAPIVWLEKEDGSIQVIGGKDELSDWVKQNFAGSEAEKKADSFLNPFESTMIQVPPRPTLGAGKRRLCVAGYGMSTHNTRAHNIAMLIGKEHPESYEIWTYGPSRDQFFEWLKQWKKEALPADSPFQAHKTSPICWFESSDGSISVLGGRDNLAEWAKTTFPGSEADKQGDKMLNPFESLLTPKDVRVN